ncbi:hypothetical protein [Streptomyces altiplanensis]
MSARDERRERYAAAVLKVKNLAGLFADVRAYVDPVLAVADAELAARPSRAEVLREAQSEVVEYLVKKAREYRSTGSQQHAMQADAIETMASKIQRGAVRLFLAAEQEKDTAPAATSTPQPDADRLAHLRNAVRDYQGEWTTRRVQHLYHAAGYGGQYRHQAREDLAHLHAHGLLVLHDEDPGRRFYTLNTWKGGQR